MKSDPSSTSQEVRIVLTRDLPPWTFPGVGMILAALFFLFLAIGGSLMPPVSPRFLPWPSSNLGKVITATVQYLVMFLPILLLDVVLVLAAALLPPLRSLPRQVRQDWSLFSLMLYPLALILILFQDEYRGLGPYQLASLAILVGGAWAYYRPTDPRWRVVILLAALALSMVALGLGIYVLYPQQSWAAHTTFPRWWEAINPLLYGAALMVILVAPAILTLLPSRATGSKVART